MKFNIQNRLLEIDEKRNTMLRKNVLSDEALDFFDNNKFPLDIMYSYYECTIMEIETKFQVLNKQYSMYYDRNPIESISSRLKSKTSLIRKMNKLDIPLNVEAIEKNINDIAGIRVVCSFIDDIYELEKSFLSQDDVKLINRKDYIENPKESGYRSLHLIVEIPIFLHNEKRMMKAEVQMRTIAMDFWASLEHKIRYKKEIDDEELERISKELYECARLSNELDLRMQAVRKDIQESQKEKSNSNMFAKILSENCDNINLSLFDYKQLSRSEELKNIRDAELDLKKRDINDSDIAKVSKSEKAYERMIYFCETKKLEYIVIDTSNKTPEETVDLIMKRIEELK